MNRTGRQTFMASIIGTMMLFCFLAIPAIASEMTDLDQQLINAVQKNDVELAKQLLFQGAAVKMTRFGGSALEAAARTGNKRMTELLLGKTDDKKLINAGLNGAVITRHVDLVALFMAKGADINNKQAAGMPPVFWAINVEDANVLINFGADIHATGQNDESILSYHARNGCKNDHRARLINHFMTLGVKPDAATFSTCAYHGNLKMLTRILNGGFDINTKGYHGQTALNFATTFTSAPDHEAVSFLLKSGADPNTQDDSGRTPLMSLAFNGQSALIKMFLEYGARLDLKDNHGFTAFDLSNASIARYNGGRVPEALLESRELVDPGSH